MRWPPSDIVDNTALPQDDHPQFEQSQIEVFENEFDVAPEYEHLRAIVESPPKDKFNVVPLHNLQSCLPPANGLKKMPKLPLKSDRIKDLMREIEEVSIGDEVDQRMQRKTSREVSQPEESHQSSDSEDGEEVPMMGNLNKSRKCPIDRSGWRWFNRSRAYILKHVRPKVSAEPEQPQLTTSVPLSFWAAFVGGFVAIEESYPLMLHILGFVLVLGYGEAVARFVSPFVGHALWVVIWLMIIAAYELVRYLNTYEITIESRLNYFVAGVIHVAFCVLTFVFELGSNLHSLYFFWLLDYFLAFPILASLIFHAFVLADNGYFLKGALVVPSTNKIGSSFSISLTFAFIMYSGITVQVYFWGNVLVAEIMVAFLIFGVVMITAYRFWMHTGTAEFASFAKSLKMVYFFIMGAVFLVALFSTGNPILPLTVAFALFFLLDISELFSILSSNSLRYTSPTLFPTFRYCLLSNKISEESGAVVRGFRAIFVLILWGYCMSIFVAPVTVGIAISSSLQVVAMGLGVYLISSSCQENLVSCELLTKADLLDCSTLAVNEFVQRNKDIFFDADIASQAQSLDVESPTRLSLHTCSRIWNELRADIDSLDYIRSIRDPNTSVSDVEQQGAAASATVDRHNQATFIAFDALAEVLLAGTGPFGFLGIWGCWSLLRSLRTFRNLEPIWMKSYNHDGSPRFSVKLSSPMDHLALSSRINEQDEQLESCYAEEMRLGATFLINLVITCDAAFQNKELVFRKFFYEYRVRLLSDGLHIPSHAFVSDSLYSLNLRLALIWMKSLSQAKMKLFQSYYLQFISTQADLDRDSLEDNNMYFQDMLHDDRVRSMKEATYVETLQKAQVKVFIRRLQHYVNRLNDADAIPFRQKQQEWVIDGRIIVPVQDRDLYETFIEAVKLDDDMITDYCKFELSETLNTGVNCSEDIGGRIRQFQDPMFLPTVDRLVCVAWKSSIRFSGNAQLVGIIASNGFCFTQI